MLVIQVLGEIFQVFQEMPRSCMSYQGAQSSISLREDCGIRLNSKLGCFEGKLVTDFQKIGKVKKCGMKAAKLIALIPFLSITHFLFLGYYMFKMIFFPEVKNLKEIPEVKI